MIKKKIKIEDKKFLDITDKNLMDTPTIFGEKQFFDSSMIVAQMYQDMRRTYDDAVCGELLKGVMAIDVKIDKEKLERWVRLCQRLDNIDQDYLIDFAIKKKFADKDYQIEKMNNRWQKLKEWIMNTLEEKQNSPKYYKLNEVLEMMQELEVGDIDVGDTKDGE